MNKRTMFFVVAVITSIIVASTVSFSTASGRLAGAPDPCELYTQSDAEALFKESVSAGTLKKTVAPAGASCRYTFKKKGGSFGITVKVSTTQAILGEGIFASALDVLTRQKKARLSSEHASSKYKAIPGLGDDAFWSGTDLWMLKGDVLVVISVHSVLEGSFKNREAADNAHSEQDLALSREVAAKIVSRLR